MRMLSGIPSEPVYMNVFLVFFFEKKKCASQCVTNQRILQNNDHTMFFYHLNAVKWSDKRFFISSLTSSDASTFYLSHLMSSWCRSLHWAVSTLLQAIFVYLPFVSLVLLENKINFIRNRLKTFLCDIFESTDNDNIYIIDFWNLIFYRIECNCQIQILIL